MHDRESRLSSANDQPTRTLSNAAFEHGVTQSVDGGQIATDASLHLHRDNGCGLQRNTSHPSTLVSP
jgi:hypothetical protein